MDQNLDHANICAACGRLCGFRKRFCNDECFERWMADERCGVHLNPGYSLVAGTVADERQLFGQKGR